MSNIESNRINICLSCDENYSKYAGVVIASILHNAKASDDIYIYVLDGNITESSKNKILSLKAIKDCSINFVKVNEEDFEDYKGLSNHSYISIPTFYRLKLASLLPNVDRIIYLDCDVVVCSTLIDLFNTDLGENVFAGVLDIDLKQKNNPNYVNAGVLLMDLNKVRQHNIEETFYNYTKDNFDNIKLADQGIINDVLKDKILTVDEKYNVQSECFIRRSSFTKNPKIIHFIGDKKPWTKRSWSVHKDLYYKYLQMTPWRLNGFSFFINKDINKINGFWGWFMHRPFFYLQKKFWKAVKEDISTKDKPKIFVILLMACFGDIILCNSLFQNIKRLFPNSKIIFVIDKPWYEAAKYQDEVDEVFIFDKRKQNRGIIGMLSFILNFPYKNIDYIFKIYDNDRMNILAQLMHPKHIIGKPYDGLVTVQERHNNLLKKITDSEIFNYPIKYISKKCIPEKFKDLFLNNKKYIALCPCSSRIEKNMPIESIVQIINDLNNDNYEVIIVGAGKEALSCTEKLINNNCNFINLVNMTTIYELAQVLKCCEALVSVDTGTMHFGCALSVPTVAIFYEIGSEYYWAPKKDLYKAHVIEQGKERLSNIQISERIREWIQNQK